MYAPSGTERDTNIGVWVSRWNLMQSSCPGYLGPIGLWDLKLVQFEDESS